MRAIKFITDIFKVEEIQQINIQEVVMALNDSSVRAHWIRELLAEIQNLNISIDHDLLQKKEQDIKDKSARRRTLQYVFEQVLLSRKRVESQPIHNSSNAMNGLTGLDSRRP